MSAHDYFSLLHHYAHIFLTTINTPLPAHSFCYSDTVDTHDTTVCTGVRSTCVDLTVTVMLGRSPL